jgi:fructose PTS system EIIA component
MTDIFQPNYIRVNEILGSQREVFGRIAELAVEQGLALSTQPVVDGLTAREQEGTTGFMDGFAIPHTKSAAIGKPGVIILTAVEGVEWESMDGKPVTFIISLLIPESEAGTTHLTLLSHISRILIHTDVRTKLLNAGTPDEILNIFDQTIVSQ